ncbi:MAG: hypothetical protein K2O05_02830, partial [Anaeroplasmataceae bacterium]|nr:hypothetical protein [Anaeroplasmataceae bacterium]
MNYGNEKYYASNSIVYYQEAWTWTQVGRESTPVYTMDALKFSFDSTHFQYALGKEIKPRIVAIDVNDSYVKYPNNNKTPIRVADNDELYNYIYPDGTLNTNFLNYQYANNINVGTGRLKLTSNNSKIKGERTLTFEITKIRIDVMNASLPDADYYGFYPDGSPLDAQTHLFNIIATGSDEFLPQGSKTVEVAVKEYDGTPWELRQWVAGQNVFGLPDGFTFSGILRTRHADAGYYWEDAGVTQSQFIGIPDGLKNIHIDNPSLWTNIEHISDFIWASNPVIRNTRGEDVSRNFEVLVTGAVSINPFEINSDNLKWPGVFNGTYYEYEYTGREIVPVPTVTNKDGVVLNPQFRVKITSAFSDPDVAIDPSDTLYSAKIMGCDTRNFIFVTYNHSPNKNFNYIDFKVVKAKLRIDMSVPNYLIGANELEFSFDFSNWAAYQQQYNIHITGLGYNSVLGGTIHTTSATEWAGWKNVRYSSNGPEYFVEWSGTSPFKVTNPTHTPEDLSLIHK